MPTAQSKRKHQFCFALSPLAGAVRGSRAGLACGALAAGHDVELGRRGSTQACRPVRGSGGLKVAE